MPSCDNADLGSFLPVMKHADANMDQTPVDSRFRDSRLARLDKLADATRERYGVNARSARIPARLIVDFDPWALSLDIVATSVSLAGMRAEIDLSRLPGDAQQLLAPGDLYRIHFKPDDAPLARRGAATIDGPAVLPLMTARLEQKEVPAGAGPLQLRFKWLLDLAVEREFQKFLQDLNP